tara:strand:+ start:49 stop:474 length:426 start_codon:yes stop_codon:yes gene_type:complete
MKRFNRLLLILISTIIIMYLFIPSSPYIYRSKINGKGLFSGKNYKKDDIIYNNLFPYKSNNTLLFNPISKDKFEKYILNEGLFINHCINKQNVKIISSNYKIFKLVATKNIKKNEEIYANYNKENKNFPFIAGALPDYVKC